MKRIILIFAVLVLTLAFTSCSNESVNETAESTTKVSTTEVQTTDTPTSEDEADNMTISVNGTDFSVVSEDNETARAFADMLPLTLAMSELHGNEKYHYLDGSLPSNPQSVGEIHKGDIMLYGNDCIVIFYKDFSTSYTYTKIGHIENTDSLEAALGSGDIEVMFR